MTATATSVLDRTNPAGYLRSALKLNQFVLYCQPVTSLKRAVEFPMAEIFVRMREEEHALLPPGEFLPVFQTFGMMPELDRWVLRETIRHGLEGSAVKSFCLNIGRQTIGDSKFLDFVAHEIRSAAFAPERLTFEVSEATAGASLVAARRFADGVRHIGARLAIQDFRCDKASLNVFQLLRANYAKVDGGIVRKLRSSGATRSCVEAVVKAIASAGAQSIAESVEDGETLSVVRQLGFDYAQGFGIFIPAPIRTVLELAGTKPTRSEAVRPQPVPTA
jgi:EAL domain-containing protein (putative c-di-GMP-specific phosphodiesterase class I)